MSTPILATKLYIPQSRPRIVLRPRLVEQLNEGLHRKLTLVSASAGFGKTTLISKWVSDSQRPVAWLSLDEDDNDPTRFLNYFVAALQTILPTVGRGVSGLLQSPQPAPIESILTSLLNEIAMSPDNFILVLDDYHVVDGNDIDNMLLFLLEHLPQQMHVVISTREDPDIGLPRLRVRGQLTELRAANLRFTPEEASIFLNDVMGLALSTDQIVALDNRTEGWIAGLQLAALSMQNHEDTTQFIHSFTGSHRFVLDYLVEEVLYQQPKSIQTFLLYSSVLDRMCGPLCDAILQQSLGSTADSHISGQETLAYLEQANLFIIPLDDERRWYRYHHLFADLLRQRLQQSIAAAVEQEANLIAQLHQRASQWYEDNNLEIEAFHHAVAAHDVERAERLIEGKGMPLHFRGAVIPILNWLSSLPTAVLDERPSLWTTYASVLLVTGQTAVVEEKLRAAELALQNVPHNDKTRDMIGRIAAIRATVAAAQNQIETIITQSNRALEYLHPNNLPFRTSTTWKLGFAYHLQGDHAEASKAFKEVISTGQASGNTIFVTMALIGLGNLQLSECQLYLASENYQQALKLSGENPLPLAGEAHLGLAKILYEWDDVEAAFYHCEQSNLLVKQIEKSPYFIAGELFFARLKFAQGDIENALTLVSEIIASVKEYNYLHLMPNVITEKILLLMHQGDLTEAEQLANNYDLPLIQARVQLAKGQPIEALTKLEALQDEFNKNGLQNKKLQVLILQSLAHQANGEEKKSLQTLHDALELAEMGGYVRSFVDEGPAMAKLLTKMIKRGDSHKEYIDKLLATFAAHGEVGLLPQKNNALVEPLSQRELEVLQLIAEGLSNREISQRLYLALDTVKGHNRRIYGKLQVQRRTEAVARALELGLL